MTVECDVLVVGGGPAGLAAATCAAEHGARVVAVDQGARPGGQVWRHVHREHLPALARNWIARCERSGARWVAEATVVDGSVRDGLVIVRRGESFVVRARRIVIATGARELFLPFPGWTLPNVLGLGGAKALLDAGMTVRGKRVVVAGTGPLVLPVAAAMARSGAHVATIAEQAPRSQVARFAISLVHHPGKVLQGARYRSSFARTRYRLGTWISRAEGNAALERVVLTNGRRTWTESCDALCCSYGLVPNTDLARLLGCAVDHGIVSVDQHQRTSDPCIYCAGEPTGVAGDAAALVEGEIAGRCAADDVTLRKSSPLYVTRDRWRRFATGLAAAFYPRSELLEHPDAGTILCRCEDVRCASIDPRWTGRQARLYTRIGMGPCQGAVCGPACQLLFGFAPGAVRPPLGAPSIAALLPATSSSARM